MKLATVLKQVRDGQPATEKTAAANSPVQSTGDKLKTALHEALSPQPAQTETKQAAAPASTPVDDLQKIASQVAASEHEALVKEAQLYGASVADGFMARLSQYNEAAEKLASQQQPSPQFQAINVATLQPPAAVKISGDDSFEKFASENTQLVKEAAELGYATTMQQMSKLAEAAQQKGFEEGTAAIYKLAHETFVRGFQDTTKLLQGLKR